MGAAACAINCSKAPATSFVIDGKQDSRHHLAGQVPHRLPADPAAVPGGRASHAAKTFNVLSETVDEKAG